MMRNFWDTLYITRHIKVSYLDFPQKKYENAVRPSSTYPPSKQHKVKINKNFLAFSLFTAQILHNKITNLEKNCGNTFKLW